MIKIEINKPLEVKFGKSGTSAKGEWEMLVIGDSNPKVHKEITLWTVGTPIGAEKGDTVTITKIDGVSYGSKKAADGSWVDQVGVNVHVVKGEVQSRDIGELKGKPAVSFVDVTEADLPF